MSVSKISFLDCGPHSSNQLWAVCPSGFVPNLFIAQTLIAVGWNPSLFINAQSETWRRFRFDSPGWAGESWMWLGEREWARNPGCSIQQSVCSTVWCNAYKQWIFAWWLASHNVQFTWIWIDFLFTRLPTWLLAATDKGLITPILFQFQIVSLSDQQLQVSPL